MKAILIFPIILLCCLKSYSQSYEDKKMTVQKVFDKIVEAYSNAKAAPKLELIRNDQNERVVATYVSSPRPTIKVDEQLVDICLGMGDDSLNALAIIISHELAHYYNDHTFCVDYAYAAGNKSRVSKEILKKNSLLVSKFNNELNADKDGIWYAAIAGYKPFGIFDKMIDRVYKVYSLNNIMEGYPSRKERKQINKDYQIKASNLLPVFRAAFILLKIHRYEEAASYFDFVISKFPSRENYNNAGVAKLMAALDLKGIVKLNFLYPVEPDPVSRLQTNSNRGSNGDKEKINTLIAAAYKDFNKAIGLDENYILSYINLACLLDINNNHDGARGKLNEIVSKDTVLFIDQINLIKAISYYNEHNTNAAAIYFDKLPDDRDSIINFDKSLFAFKDDLNDNRIAAYKTAWAIRNNEIQKDPTQSQKDNLFVANPKYDASQSIEEVNQITVRYSSNQQALEIVENNNQVLQACRNVPSSQWILKMNGAWLKKNSSHLSQWLLIQL